MSDSNEIRDFLMSRRERVQPEDVGLPRGRRRRVPGLRREEVAVLAGVSVDYYVQLERGDLSGASDDVLAAISRGLQLDEVETGHLFDLARAVRRTPDRRPGGRASRPPLIPAALRQLVESMSVPAVLQTGGLDLVAANPPGRAFYRHMFDVPGSVVPNLGRYVYFDDRSRAFFNDWEGVADDVAAMLRVEVARAPESSDTALLVQELREGSRAFEQRWAAHDVRDHRRGRKVVNHPDVGTLHLLYEALGVGDRSGLQLFAYTADPDDPQTAQNLALLRNVEVRVGAEGSARLK